MQIFKKTIILSAVGVIALFAVSCKKSPFKGYTEERQGVYYKFYTSNEKAAKLETGDLIRGSISVWKNDSVELDNTNGQTVTLGLLDSSNFMYPVLKNAHLGDSISIIFLADTLKNLKIIKLSNEIKATDYIKFSLKIVDKMSKNQLDSANNVRMKAMETAQANEKASLQKYLTDNKIQATPTESGLIYIETKKGTGKEAVAGKSVKVNYAGYLIDGTLFDTSIEKIAKDHKLDQPGREFKPIDFPLGMGYVIPGWDEAIAKMKVGGKAKLIIPSSIAYGAQGRPSIPPFSTLVFDVELLDVFDAPATPAMAQ